MKRNVHAVHAAGLSLDISFSSVFFFVKSSKGVMVSIFLLVSPHQKS